MTVMNDIEESYIETKHRTVFTFNELKIPGIRVFGKQSIAFAEINPRSHAHKNCFEFSIVEEGAFRFYMEDEEYNIAGGKVFMSFPNMYHSAAEIPVSMGVFYWFQLDISVLEDFLFLCKEARQYYINELIELSNPIIKVNQKESIGLCKKIFELIAQGDSPFVIASYFVILINNLITYSKKTNEEISNDIQKSVDYINEHLIDDIKLQELANISYLSISHFKQKFRNQMGVSPRNYINMRKITVAKKLLLEGKKKTEIAMLLNFNTSSYFASVFKKYTGQTPSEFIKKDNK